MKELPTYERKNSRVSLALILLNVLLVLIAGNIGNPPEDAQIKVLLIAAIEASALLVLFVFTYKGRPYRYAKWLLALVLLATLALGALVAYFSLMAKAFQH